MKNSLAVLIPTKDRRKLLERALQSILNQTVRPDEVVIVNDGSKEDTQQFLGNIQSLYGFVKIIHRKTSGGVNAARNEGIRSIMSDWIVFLDDDDELVLDAISVIKNKIHSTQRDYSVLFFNTLIKRDKEEFVGGFQFKDNSDFIDPTYEEFMVKHGLRGDCKPVFNRRIFSSGKYWFEETVNGFESITLRRMIKDGNLMRYYKYISTIVHQQTNFEHLSFTASLKNPYGYLVLHEKDLEDHKVFYRNHPMVLREKYLAMCKLAYRAKKYIAMIYYGYRYVVSNNRFV